MQFSKLKTALAVANLRNLGYQPKSAVLIGHEWANRQASRSINFIESELKCSLDIENKFALDSNGEGRLFASCHFSLYPLLFGELASQSKNRKVVSLIGMQSSQHQASLVELAHRFNVDLEFIASGFSMIREMKRALKQGNHGIILIDIPWAQDRRNKDLDCQHQAHGGRFRAKTSLFKLISIIDEYAKFALVQKKATGYQIIDFGLAQAANSYKAFAEVFHSDPADYERLHQMHQYFEFKEMANSVINFCVDGDHFALSSKTLKAWKMKESELEPGEILKSGTLIDRYRDLVGEDVTEIISI